jgi:putative transcriptional regulator
MTPVHHPEPDELVAYASGASPEWLSLVIACHLTFCEECRRDVQLFDDLGGALLESVETDDAPLSLPPLGDKLSPEAIAGASRQPSRQDPPGLPRPIYEYMNDGHHFRYGGPGVRQIPLSLTVNGEVARIVRFAPGHRIPDHAHRGLEMILVLDGEFEDAVTGERYRSGDLSRREGGTEHQPHVTGSDPCIAMVVATARSQPHTLWGKILQAITGV